jgi:hypothetical protein
VDPIVPMWIRSEKPLIGIRRISVTIVRIVIIAYSRIQYIFCIDVNMYWEHLELLPADVRNVLIIFIMEPAKRPICIIGFI